MHAALASKRPLSGEGRAASSNINSSGDRMPDEQRRLKRKRALESKISSATGSISKGTIPRGGLVP